MTVWKRVLTALPIQKSSQTAKSPNSSSHVNSTTSQQNHLNKAAWNATSHYPYLSLPMHQCPTTQSRTRMITALPCLRSCQSSIKLEGQKNNIYAMGHANITHIGAWHIHTSASLKTLLIQETEYKSNGNAYSTVGNLKTTLPLSVLSSVGEDGRIGASISVIWYKRIDSHIRGH